MLQSREDMLKEALEAINFVMDMHDIPHVKPGSPAYNKLAGHIDRELANLAPKRPMGRPKQARKLETVKV